MNKKEWVKALQFLSHIKKSGYNAYIVGGAIRDCLLHRQIHDFDVVTEADSREIEKLFPHAIRTSRHFPIFIIRWGNLTFEVTTFRQAAKELADDLRLRDFTVNAMALDEYGGIIDPWQGYSDLKNKIIRSIEPGRRFYEDPIRMIRAFRFQAVLGFSIEGKTREALRQQKNFLVNMPPERIRTEIGKLLNGRFHDQALHSLSTINIWQYFPYKLRAKAANFQASSWNMTRILTEEGRWTAFFLRLYENEAASRVPAWMFSKKQKKLIQNMIQCIVSNPEGIPWNSYRVYLMGHAAVETERVFQWYYNQGSPWGVTDIVECLKKLPINNKQDMAVNGVDIIKAFPGIRKEWIGRMLTKAEEAITMGKVNNEKTDLLIFLKETYRDEK